MDGFHKEILAPHDTFIHAQILRLVVDAVFEDALPAWGFVGQILWASERI